MKSLIEIHKCYKEETGEPYSDVPDSFDLFMETGNEWQVLTIKEYISWLENKIIELTEKVSNHTT